MAQRLILQSQGRRRDEREARADGLISVLLVEGRKAEALKQP